jgi:hypothetical protein
MSPERRGLPVLARFPDLNDGKLQAGADKAKGWGLLASSRRLIGQAMSFKLLAGMALFLLIGAILPWIGRDTRPVNSPPVGDATATWHPRGSEASAEAAPAKCETVAMTVAQRLPVRICAAAELLPAPAMLPPTAEIKREPQAAPTVAESLMSNWTPPARVDLQPARPGVEALTEGVNPPVAARSTEYQAVRPGWQQR